MNSNHAIPSRGICTGCEHADVAAFLEHLADELNRADAMGADRD